MEEIVNGTAMIVERGHLKEVNYPKTLRKIPGGLFHNCPEIKEFNIDPENPYFCAIEGAIYTKDGKKLISYEDILPDKQKVKALVDLCNDLDAAPEHMPDILEDFLP
jgi:hypothetical protein